MGWLLLGVFLSIVYFVGWAVILTGEDADARAVARYEAERDAFERMFE